MKKSSRVSRHKKSQTGFRPKAKVSKGHFGSGESQGFTNPAAGEDLKRQPYPIKGRQESKQSLGIRYDPKTPGLEILRRCKFLFVRHVDRDLTLLAEAEVVSSYEVYLPNGDRVYFIQEFKGDGQRNSKADPHREFVCCMLTSLGREILRMEGNHGSVSYPAKILVYQGAAFIGEIRQTHSSCAPSVFNVIDDNSKEVVRIERCKEDNGKYLLACCKNNTKVERYDTFLPPQMTKMSTMGMIAKLFPEVSSELEDCFGVEIPDALNIREKALLLASVFIVFPRLTVPYPSVLNKVRTSVTSSVRSAGTTSSKFLVKAAKSLALKDI